MLLKKQDADKNLRLGRPNGIVVLQLCQVAFLVYVQSIRIYYCELSSMLSAHAAIKLHWITIYIPLCPLCSRGFRNTSLVFSNFSHNARL